MLGRTAKVLIGAGGLSLVGVAALVLLVFVPMCSNKLDGQATIDGAAFVPDSCHSGQRWNFVGVQIEAKGGRKLRAAETVTGAGDVIVFPANADRGVELGACADFSVERQHSTINDITNVEGQVVLHCPNATGTIAFENCH
jgi:hypothetical protein